MTDHWIRPITLSDELVSLLPLELDHRSDLLSAASDGQLWKLWYTSVPSSTSIDDYLNTAISQRQAKQALPFTIYHQGDQKVIGSTRYCNIEASHRRLEIGYTWYAKSYQRTAVNTHCKYLLLSHAFETLNCIAVEFRTHWFNHASRNAILRLGAKQDGILRNHRIDSQGRMRDSVVYSITNTEWPTVKQSLEYRMGRN